MTSFEAKVTQNIPANRLIGLGGINTEGNPEEGWETIYLKLAEKGWIPDFVSTSGLKDGDVVTVKITDKPVWKVEASGNLPAGTLVQCDDEGKVKYYSPDDGGHFGYTLHSAEDGEVVEVVRKYGYQPPTSQVEAMSIPGQRDVKNLTNAEIKKLLNKEGIEYNSNATKNELISLLDGDA